MTKDSYILIVKQPDDALTVYLNGHRIAGPSSFGNKRKIVYAARVRADDLAIASSSVFGYEEFAKR